MNRKISMMASTTLLLAFAAAPLLSSCSRAEPPAGNPRVAASPSLSPAVRAELDTLFANDAMMGETRAVLVLRDGRPIYEAYGPSYSADSKLISWSMAKSITAVLIGFMVADGRLVLDDPAPVPAWQRPGDPRGTITLRNLLTMSSGLDHLEEGDPVWEADTVAMLFGDGAGDMAAMAEAKPPVAAPDQVFNYSSSTSVILSDILARALTDSKSPAVRRNAVLALLQGRLAAPLGISSMTPEFDPAGTMIGGSIVHATARDYAKFGEFLRRRGETATGQRIMPESWFRFMLSSAPANPGYGGHIWLNRPNPNATGVALWPQDGPADLFACIGHQGQYIVVSPRQKHTVVRLGTSTDDQFPNVRAALRRAMAGL